MKILLSKKESGMPLYLSLACEELRVFGIYEKVHFSVHLLVLWSYWLVNLRAITIPKGLLLGISFSWSNSGKVG